MLLSFLFFPFPSFFLSFPSFCCPFFCLGVFQLLLYIRLVTNLWVSCRFLFCQAVLMLYAPTFNKKEFHPMCMPPLPSSVLPTATNSQIAVMQIANIFGAVNSFIFSEGVKLPENRHGDDMDVISSYWKHVSGAEWAWICKNMYLFRWVSNIFTKMFVVPWVSGSARYTCSNTECLGCKFGDLCKTGRCLYIPKLRTEFKRKKEMLQDISNFVILSERL